MLNQAIDVVLPALHNIPSSTSIDQLHQDAPKLVDLFLGEILKVAPIIKDRGFEEEKEWKAVSAPITNLEFRSQGDFLRPYFAVPLDLANKYMKVVVGPSPHAELARDSCELLIRWRNPLRYDILPSVVPFLNF